MTCQNCKANNAAGSKTCWSCGAALSSDGGPSGHASHDAAPQEQRKVYNDGARVRGPTLYSRYKVVVIEESGLSTILVGSAKLPLEKIEKKLNDEARIGWQVVFQVVEKRRFLLFWSREAMIVTLGHV